MAKTDNLANQLRDDYPELVFEPSDDFYWSAKDRVVYFVSDDSSEALDNLLHETAHALLGHNLYKFDIDLIRIEGAAWTYARRKLAPRYKIVIDEDLVEDSLDSYRDWLHKRSLCPSCGQTGLENDDKSYVCLNCQAAWRPNDARRCGLRRRVKH
jgi:hypothetical protein